MKGPALSFGGAAALSLAIMAAPAGGTQTPPGTSSPTDGTQALPGSAPAVGAQTPAGADAGIAPFTAHYLADWKSINVGTSDLELKPDSEPGHYIYTWTITARGIFRLYRAEVTQKSWLSIDAGHVRPDKYRAEDGSSSVSLDFDWNNRRARGTSEKKPVDLPLKDGTQDVMSIQVEVMLDLKKGDLPKTFQIIDKDELKEFNYSKKGTPASEPPWASSIRSSWRAGRPATIASCACGLRLHWASCRFKRSAPATASSNSRCASNP